MFPPHVPRVFIEWLTRAGDIVYDPFSGRGTAPLEACRLGRVGIGSDANPLAYVLTGAKVDPPTEPEVSARLDYLRKHQPRKHSIQAPPEIEMLYTPKVLRQLGYLRDRLDLEDRTDRFIMAVVLGMLHANYKPGGTARGLSISMPNTFSMSPAYVRRYIEQHRLRAPQVDVFDLTRARVARLNLPGPSASRGRAWLGDARTPRGLEQPAQLIFTSPPYLSVIKYGKYNWIRLWMLGHDPKTVDSLLTATASLSRYIEFMAEFLTASRSALTGDGYLCLMIGDVGSDKDEDRPTNLAHAVWRKAALPAGWRKLGTVSDHLPEEHKVSRIWGKKRRGNATKVDRILMLAPPASSHELPPARNSISWSDQATWAVDAKGAR
jgi:site-specific DNA-methyltransferase (adenine-specific)